MLRRGMLALALLLAGLPIAACGSAPRGRHEPTVHAGGPALTFSLGGQRFALAVMLPVDLLIVRTGPYIFWATPNFQAHDLYLDERSRGGVMDTRILAINTGGSVDYDGAISWSF